MSAPVFETVKMSAPKYNTFDLTHDVKLSTRMGWLTPIMITDVIPGDKFKIGCEALIRFAPLIAPVMHRIDCYMHYFYVPNRIVWENYPLWVSSQPDPETDLVPAHPYFELNPAQTQERLADFLGLPQLDDGAGNKIKVSAIPFAAYQMIYNEYYRDQNLIPEVKYKLDDGDNTARYNDDYKILRKRAWEHDYFTSALPFAQKGVPVSIPLGDVILDPNSQPGQVKIRDASNYTLPETGALDSSLITGNLTAGGNAAVIDPNGTLSVEATTINDLRRAVKLQEWLEKNARGGTRYTEFLKVQYGVISSDARLQRPEYITGTKSSVVISEVLNTTGTDNAPQGAMAGHGISVVDSYQEHYDIEEHGYIIGIMSIMPKTAYQQGIEKHWLKYDDATQVYFESFAHLGEQPIEIRELYADLPTDEQKRTFGYIPRYAEHKYVNNRVAGDFKTNLAFWTLARIFDNQPELNQEFIECNPDDLTRIFAVETGDNLWCQVLNKVEAWRPMPVYGTPSVF